MIKRTNRILLVFLTACLIVGSVGGCVTYTHQTYELVISDGRVIDPETGLDAVRNIGIYGKQIKVITTKPLQGKQQIDATGLVVSPGFIDLHSHAQNLVGQTYQIHDGVTTALELESGALQFPSQDDEIKVQQKRIHNRKGRSLIHYGYSASYTTARYLAKNKDGHKTYREHANAAELNQLLSLIEKELDHGALGIGFLLDYMSPAVNQQELEAVFRLAARRNVPLFTHIRMANDALDPSGFEELVALVRKTGASLHMVHITSTGLGRTPQYIERLKKARADDFDITTELYPYTAASTGINTALFDQGWQARWGIDYHDIVWPPTGERFTGKAMWDQYREKYPQGNIIFHAMNEEWLKIALRYPDAIVASDAMITNDFNQRAHPRGRGTYARVLGRYVREMQVLSLPEAISKMTYLPAKRLQDFTPAMTRKGRIQVGADADITLFDPGTVIDQATFSEPNQFSRGIKHVIVGGQIVVSDEVILEGVFPGKAISAKNKPE